MDVIVRHPVRIKIDTESCIIVNKIAKYTVFYTVGADMNAVRFIKSNIIGFIRINAANQILVGIDVNAVILISKVLRAGSVGADPAE